MKANLMTSEIIKRRLEELKKEGKFDKEFIEVLLTSNETNEDADDTISKITALIGKRYVENKEGKI
jgi:hypothetical protein